jgi:hypothetical protein
MATIERLCEVLSYEPEMGVLRWKVATSNRVRVGDVAGSPRKLGHWQVRIDGKIYLCHRVVWAIVHGVWPDGEIDHINGIASDNRLSNLRVVDRRTNSENKRRAHSNNIAGFLGVSQRPYGRFGASIISNGKFHWLGAFDTPSAASAAYVTAKRQIHAGCTL